MARSVSNSAVAEKENANDLASLDEDDDDDDEITFNVASLKAKAGAKVDAKAAEEAKAKRFLSPEKSANLLGSDKRSRIFSPNTVAAKLKAERVGIKTDRNKTDGSKTDSSASTTKERKLLESGPQNPFAALKKQKAAEAEAKVCFHNVKHSFKALPLSR